jgi:uncharacterized protein
MHGMNFRKYILFLLVGFAVSARAQQNYTGIEDLLKQRPDKKLVHDYTGKLSPTQVDHLEKKLVAYDDSTSTQIAVLLVPSLNGYSIETAANEIYRKWGLGSKDNNNGALILAAINDRKIRIEVGYGLESSVTDYTCGEIIDNDIKPNFRANNYYQGLEQATDNIILAVAGKYKAPKGYHKNTGAPGGFLRLIILMFIIFIILVVISKRGGGGGGMLSRRGYRDWSPPVIIGDWGNRGGGGGWSGGGGGFGGFGGGSSGGGGASGDW